MKRLLCFIALLFAFPAGAQDVDPQLWTNPSFPVRDRQVDDDPRAAYRAVWDLYYSAPISTSEGHQGLLHSYALRVWLWRRDLTLLEGGTPPHMKVGDAIYSPLANEAAYRKAAEAYLSKWFSIRLAVDRADPDAADHLTRLAPGIYVTRGGAVKLWALVTNHGSMDAWIAPTVYFPKVLIMCDGVQLAAGAEGGTWCPYAGGFATQAQSVAFLTEAIGSFDGRVTDGSASIGEPARYVMTGQAASNPPEWETKLGVSSMAGAAALERERYAPTASRGISVSAWGMVGLLVALIVLGGILRSRYASRPLVPRFLFVVYVVLVVAGLFISALDKGAGAPMSGVLSVLVELGLGLPWTLSLLTPENHMPDDSLFPWLFTLGNAALLFVFSSQGERE